MKIELRRLTHNARLSQETNAYAADVYIDGRKAGTVRNDGGGGESHVHITPSELFDRAWAWCESLPPDTSGGTELKMDLPFYLDMLADQAVDRYGMHPVAGLALGREALDDARHK